MAVETFIAIDKRTSPIINLSKVLMKHTILVGYISLPCKSPPSTLPLEPSTQTSRDIGTLDQARFLGSARVQVFEEDTGVRLRPDHASSTSQLQWPQVRAIIYAQFILQGCTPTPRNLRTF